MVLKAPSVTLCFAHCRSHLEQVFKILVVVKISNFPTQSSGESPHNSGDLLGCGSCLSNLEVTQIQNSHPPLTTILTVRHFWTKCPYITCSLCLNSQIILYLCPLTYYKGVELNNNKPRLVTLVQYQSPIHHLPVSGSYTQR